MIGVPLSAVGEPIDQHDYASDLLAHILPTPSATAPNPTIHRVDMPPRSARYAAWPSWMPTEIRDALVEFGTSRPWSHQRAAADLIRSGVHTVVSSGTSSGKSLAFRMPIVTTLHEDSTATALYIAPTKALGADQLHDTRLLCDRLFATSGTTIGPCAYDGDSSPDVRRWAMENSRWIFTNPDMIHHGLLPRHERWGRLLRRLRYVVIDESHVYRGVFGSHVALVLRRLRRLARRYGSDPVFILASATTADPGRSASTLIGSPVAEVTTDGSPHGKRSFVLWEPALLETAAAAANPASESGAETDTSASTIDASGLDGGQRRRSSGADAAEIMAGLVLQGARTLTFVGSRRGAEFTALGARRRVAQVDPALAERIVSYRSGYLPEERRDLEAGLNDGRIVAAATTNALELGIDIAGLDAVVLSGFPGTRASFWQQAGRAGRREQHSVVILVARDNPLDAYLVHHPEALFDAPVEATVIDPTNPYVLGPHLLHAAAEIPLTTGDLDDLSGHAVTADLVDAGLLRRRATGWFITPDSLAAAQIDIRGGTGTPVAIVEHDTGRLLGHVDAARAPYHVHPGAVYLHRGESFVVDDLDLDGGVALVRAETPDWSTTARSVTDIRLIDTVTSRAFDGIETGLARVEVTTRVVGYLRTLSDGTVLDMVELVMPQDVLVTRAVYWTITPELLERAGIDPATTPGALHAAEHAAIGLLPLVATCDRWDIGGVSTAGHPDTGLPTVFVYDGNPGGAGFADRGYAQLRRWLGATADAVRSCDCRSGCPACVYSSKCGNGNSPLDKAAAIAVLDTVGEVLAAADGRSDPSERGMPPDVDDAGGHAVSL